MGYYPNWAIYCNPQLMPEEIDGRLVTPINYAFANWDLQSPYCGNFKKLNDLKKKYPHLKTLISVGGWTLSDPFSVMAANPESRANFVKNALEFCRKYGFDGIDIDWEYPGYKEHSGGPNDKQNFTLLLAELRAAAQTINRLFLITIAAPAGPHHIKEIEIEKIHRYLDWINLMTYDFHGPWADAENAITNHHSPLYPPPQGDPKLCVTAAVQAYLDAGVPPEKLVLGMPLYGRVFAQASGLHSPYQGLPQKWACVFFTTSN